MQDALLVKLLLLILRSVIAEIETLRGKIKGGRTKRGNLIVGERFKVKRAAGTTPQGAGCLKIASTGPNFAYAIDGGAS